MKRRILFLAGLGLLAAIVVGEARWAARQQSELGALRRRHEELAAESAALASAGEKTAVELNAAERQLAALSTRTDPAGASAERASEMKTWLARVKQLRGLFAARPGERIPEMRWLTDEDWLRVAKRCDLGSEEGVRKALADVRGAAIGHFAPQIAEALRKFAKTATVDTPADIRALGAFFASPVDPEILGRYALSRRLEAGTGGAGWSVQNTVALDPIYDWCYRVKAYARGGYGVESGPGVWAWIPDLSERYEKAAEDYRRANQGRLPADMGDVVPFIVPPLAPDVAARLIEDARKGWK